MREKIKISKIPSNRFDLSHDIITSLDLGRINPCKVTEVLPGDYHQIKYTNFIRLSPLVSPAMTRLKVKTEAFFVPLRLLWSEFEDFMTNEVEVEPPKIAGLDINSVGSVADYMGLPIDVSGVNASFDISAMPFAAYQLIYDEWYRDQNLIDEKFVPLQSGLYNSEAQSTAYGKPYRRSWRRDYFTSALPFAQKGDEATIPVVASGDVDVYLKDNHALGRQYFRRQDGSMYPLPGRASMYAVVRSPEPGEIHNEFTSEPAYLDPAGTFAADLTSADFTPVTINNLRTAIMYQEYLERNARGGTRYTENILAHFGVKSDDGRLQRPELIGSSVQNVVISEVLSTAQTETTSGVNPVGQMAGHGISAGGTEMFSYNAKEHGYIIVMTSVYPDSLYQQGVERMWRREDNLDYAHPIFANLGEQAIKNSEIYLADTIDPNGDFGYLPRYSEYRYGVSHVTGQMRDDLEYYHLGRRFDEQPLLNESFLNCEPSKRIFAVTDEEEHPIYAHIIVDHKVQRKLPKYGTPQL